MKAISNTSDYLLQDSINSLHRESIEWTSELNMFNMDADFFSKILAKSALKVLSDDTYNEMHKNLAELSEMMRAAEVLTEKVKAHEKTLESFIEETASHDEQKYRIEHAVLNDELYQFFCMYKEKKAVIQDLLRPLILRQLI